jgi:hypothetical protein
MVIKVQYMSAYSLVAMHLNWSGTDSFYIRERSSFMAGAGRGTEEKRVKWKTKQLKGWVIQSYFHSQSMTHSNIED